MFAPRFYSLLSALFLLGVYPSVRATAAPPLDAGATSRPFAAAGTVNYRFHVLAIDGTGSALDPVITRTDDANGQPSYHASFRQMPGEDTRKEEKDLPEEQRNRAPLYLYIDTMLEEIARRRPREIVIYIHGGMNSVAGALEKGAWLADHLHATEPDVYPICICWDSDLFRNYFSHLFKVRAGLNRPGVAIASSPVYLATDVAASIVRAPATWLKLTANDVYAAAPQEFSRYRQAELRQRYYRQTEFNDGAPGVHSSRGYDDRPVPALLGDLVAFGLTTPTKLATAPFIDVMGSPAWQNMLRNTRTMFERESNYVRLPRDTASDLATRNLGKNIFLGRIGALRLFLERAEARLGSAPSRPYGRITLVGHSMGAIVGGEILTRFHGLRFDNIVFVGAASTVNDFRLKVTPYLEAQPRTHFWNLCLNGRAERSEKVFYDIPPRGSLLVWIDNFLDNPASEGDRTLGRWENSVLAMDNLPPSLYGRVTVKSFGRDRPRVKYPKVLPYTDPRSAARNRSLVAEPLQHADFAHSSPNPTRKALNYRFWSPEFRDPEPESYDQPVTRPIFRSR